MINVKNTEKRKIKRNCWKLDIAELIKLCKFYYPEEKEYILQLHRSLQQGRLTSYLKGFERK